jgi:glutathione S-transferase
MITLYHAPKTRASRFLWLLEEIGEPYEVKRAAMRSREAAESPEAVAYRRIHPHGKVPAITDDGVPIFESAAIALYLGDAFPRAGLAPPIGDAKRGPYVTWLAYYAGVLEPAFVGKALGFTTTNSTTGWASTDEVLAYVIDTLKRGPYLLGDRFSTADVLFGSTLALFKGSPLLPKNETIEAYVASLVERPAYQRGLAKDAG